MDWGRYFYQDARDHMLCRTQKVKQSSRQWCHSEVPQGVSVWVWGDVGCLSTSFAAAASVGPVSHGTCQVPSARGLQSLPWLFATPPWVDHTHQGTDAGRSKIPPKIFSLPSLSSLVNSECAADTGSHIPKQPLDTGAEVSWTWSTGAILDWWYRCRMHLCIHTCACTS